MIICLKLCMWGSVVRVLLVRYLYIIISFWHQHCAFLLFSEMSIVKCNWMDFYNIWYKCPWVRVFTYPICIMSNISNSTRWIGTKNIIPAKHRCVNIVIVSMLACWRPHSAAAVAADSRIYLLIRFDTHCINLSKPCLYWWKTAPFKTETPMAEAHYVLIFTSQL